jgi:ABC-type polysaccharide/polyol phosphate export permease
MWTSDRPPQPVETFPGRRRSFDAVTMRRHLHLVWELVIAHFKVKDQTTIVGFGWSFLHPLLMLALLFVFFRERIGGDIPHYGVFLLIGIVHYTHFANSTNAAATVLAVMRDLTTETLFPKALLVIASVIGDAFELCVSMGVCLLIAVVAGVPLTPVIVLLPLVMLLQIWTVLWLSLLLACAYVFTKDVAHIYQVFLRILFFITPTFYSPTFLGSGLAQFIVLANPLAHFIQLSRTLILDGELPSPGLVLGIVVANVVATIASLAIFRSREPLFAERL